MVKYLFTLNIVTTMLVLLLVAGCAPSINPALKKRVDSYTATASKKTYDSDELFTKPMPWAVGQYIVTRTVDGDGKPSIARMSIVEKKKNGWILEVHTLSYTAESLAQLYVSGFDKGTEVRSLNDLDIKWTKIKDKDGKITKVDGNALGFAQSLEKSGVVTTSVDAGKKAKGTIKVPAGKFRNVTVFEGRGKIGGFIDFKSSGWYHPQVPIFGSIKTTTSTPKTKMELLKFGLSGAKSKF